MQSDYLAIVFGRNGNHSIRYVLNSLLTQTVLPARINVIDDGSTDGMSASILEYSRKYPNIIFAQETYNEKSDFSRLPLLWNMGMERTFSFHLILPSDASLNKHYAERLLKEFDKNPNLAIASGDWGYMKSVAPHGGGRFVRQAFFNRFYPNGYPRILGYESEILERAILEGCDLLVLNDLEITHHDALGHSHNFKEFGYGMKCLGYYPPYAIARIVWDFFNNQQVGKRGALNMLRYYIFFRPEKEGYYSKFPADIRLAVRERQKRMLKRSLTLNILGKTVRLAQKTGIKNTGLLGKVQEIRQGWKI